MKALLSGLVFIGLFVNTIQATQTVDYGWEDGGTILGKFG